MSTGCEACRQGYADRLRPALVPARQVLQGRAGAWAADTYRCSACGQWSRVVRDAREGVYGQLFYTASLDEAAREDADIASAWPPLFARERRSYLRHGGFDADAALTRVLEQLNRDALVGLPMLVDLLTLENPQLRALQRSRGPLWTPPRAADFDAPIERLDRWLSEKSPADATSVYLIDLECLRTALLRSSDGTTVLFHGATPAPAITPRPWARDFPRGRPVPVG